MKIVCIGHSVYDVTFLLDSYPKENLKYRASECISCGGGNASTGAYLLALWKVDTIFLSAVGNDYYGSKIIEEFNNIGLDTKYIEKIDNFETHSSFIIANKENGSRTIITSKKQVIRKLQQEANIKTDVILLDGEHPETAKELLLNNKNTISILDAEKVNDDIMELGKMVTYVICSKSFAEKFSNLEIDINNIDTLITCYEKLKKYFNTNIIITLDEVGSFTKIDEYEIIPSIKVKSIDSTGAGDIFHGAFTYFISNNYSLKDSIKYSSIAAALSTEKIGTRYSVPSLEEVLNYDRII